MSTIFLVRHGQASFGADNYDRLSENGLRQAECLAEHLHDFGVILNAVYSGPMERQRETARAVSDHYDKNGHGMLAIRELAAFAEYPADAILAAHVALRGRTEPGFAVDWDHLKTDRKSFQRLIQEAMTNWISGNLVGDGVEPWRNFQSRVKGGLEQVMDECGGQCNVLISTSGGGIAVVMQQVLGLSDDHAIRLNWQVFNSSVSAIFYNSAKQLSLSSFNSIPHLEKRICRAKITYR